MRNWIIFLVLMAGLGAWGWHYYQGRAVEQNTPTYRTQPATRGAISSSVTATGIINPVSSVRVGTPVSGIVKDLYVDYNSEVRAGQVIARIDPAIFQAQVDQAHGNLLAAKANVIKAKATLADARRTEDRQRQLAVQGLVARSDHDAALTAVDTAAASLAASEAAVRQVQGAYVQAQTNLNYATIRSPVDGIVVNRDVEVGQTVAASFQSPTLFLIARDLTKMQVEVSVDEADIGSIHEQSPAAFSVDAYPEERFHGVVQQVRNAPVTVQNVVTYVVVVAVSNPELKLKPGMTANVTFMTEHADNALKVPAAALRFKPRENAKDGVPVQGKQVHVLVNGQPKAVPVVVGILSEGEVEIRSGEVREGQEVIVEAVVAQKKGMSFRPPMGGPM